MPVKICEKCRRIRLAVMAMLIVFAALAGYHWGHMLETGAFQSPYLVYAAAGSTFGAVLLGLWAEALVARTERAAAQAEAERARLAETADISKEQARELDRIVCILTDDNADLRYRLLSNKVHQVAQDRPTEEVAVPLSAAPAAEGRQG